jgi:hypothetical protein
MTRNTADAGFRFPRETIKVLGRMNRAWMKTPLAKQRVRFIAADIEFAYEGEFLEGEHERPEAARNSLAGARSGDRLLATGV